MFVEYPKSSYRGSADFKREEVLVEWDELFYSLIDVAKRSCLRNLAKTRFTDVGRIVPLAFFEFKILVLEGQPGSIFRGLIARAHPWMFPTHVHSVGPNEQQNLAETTLKRRDGESRVDATPRQYVVVRFPAVGGIFRQR
ncbi:hypothetical protein A5678_04520 [Mycobacterium sp. E2733]|nr:hypothetical protein A5678_04520 [Mycobacterium sp. E2733]